MSEELKPCPFCGGEAEIVDSLRPWVRCSNQKCPIKEAEIFKPGDQRKRAIDAWNTRQLERIDEGELLEILNEGVASEFESLKKSLGEVPENTCPDIDKLIKAISETDKILQQAHRYDDVGSFAEDLEWHFRDIDDSILEDIRAKNETLREIGREWYKLCKWIVETQGDSARAITQRFGKERIRVPEEEEHELDCHCYDGNIIAQCTCCAGITNAAIAEFKRLNGID